MSNLQVFVFPVTSQEVRVKGSADSPMFCLVDICSVLGLSNASQIARSQLKQDGIILADTIDSLGRSQSSLFVNEANLYRCVMRSEKPSAIAFQDWLVEEVLPTIRKTGNFGSKINADSKASEFWQIIDSAIERGIDPFKTVATHQKFCQEASKHKVVPFLPSAKLEDRVYKFISSSKPDGATARDIVRHFRLVKSSEQAKAILQGMVNENRLIVQNTGRTSLYRIC